MLIYLENLHTCGSDVTCFVHVMLNNDECKMKVASDEEAVVEDYCQSSVVCVMCFRLLCPYMVCFLSSSDVIIG